ncbi:MAG: hypothetical protein HQ536_02115 [Parcubacteria group bacterium]|nr:hypothetical protein [Parcubacteria group bacterium]
MMAYVSERENKKDIDLQLKSRQYNILTVSLILLIVSVLSSIFLNTRPVIASNYAIKSIDALFLDPKIGEDYFKKSVDIWSPYHDAARIKFSNAVYLLVNNDILNKAEKKQLVLYAINEVKKSELNHPNDFSYPLTLGNLYSSIEEYPLAYEEYERALTLSPKRQVVYFQFASAKFLAGEENEARDILRRAVELNKNVKESHWRLGLGLIGDDNQVAIEEAKKAIMLGYYPPKMEEINAFASVFIETNDWEGLVSFYEFLVKSNGGPADTYTRLKNKCLEVGLTDILDTCTRYAEIYAQLAAAYLEAGQKERARDTALRAAELDPSFKKETELFIKLLENR